MVRYVKEFDEQIWSLAESRVKLLPIYWNSHRKEQANQVGVLGEIVTELWLNHLKISFEDVKSIKHDYLIKPVNKTLEIKTKDRTVIPIDDFECSVPLYNHSYQIPDYYLFISLLRDRYYVGENIRRFKKAYILGVSNQKLLHELGIVWKEGQTDPSNGTKFWTDCISLKIHQLISPDKVKNIWS